MFWNIIVKITTLKISPFYKLIKKRNPIQQSPGCTKVEYKNEICIHKVDRICFWHRRRQPGH